MFDIGWSELLLIGIVALIVVGPKELPQLFRTVGQFMGKARGMAREFQRSMEQAADDSGLNEAANSLKSINKVNLNSATSSARKYAEKAVTGGQGKQKPKPAAEKTETVETPAGSEPAPERAPSAAEAAAAETGEDSSRS